MTTLRRADNNIWSEFVHQWLLSEPEYGENLSEIKSRRKRLAQDKRLSDTAKKLEKIAQHSGQITTLLEIASSLPESFAFFKGKKQGFRNEEIKKLGKGARTFLALLIEQRALAEYYLEPFIEDTNEAIRIGSKNFNDLIENVKSIAAAAEKGIDVIPPDAIPKLSRKKHFQNAEKLFCIRRLSLAAKKLFKKPLYSEVGLIITVCLNLKTPIDSDEVRDLCR